MLQLLLKRLPLALNLLAIRDLLAQLIDLDGLCNGLVDLRIGSSESEMRQRWVTSLSSRYADTSKSYHYLDPRPSAQRAQPWMQYK